MKSLLVALMCLVSSSAFANSTASSVLLWQNNLSFTRGSGHFGDMSSSSAGYITTRSGDSYSSIDTGFPSATWLSKAGGHVEGEAFPTIQATNLFSSTQANARAEISENMTLFLDPHSEGLLSLPYLIETFVPEHPHSGNSFAYAAVVLFFNGTSPTHSVEVGSSHGESNSKSGSFLIDLKNNTDAVKEIQFRSELRAFATVVPLPASLPLLLSGLGLVGFSVRKKSIG